MSTVIQASTEIDLEDAAVARKKPEDSTDRELMARLVDQARAEGVELVGENGLLGRLTKLVLESALEGAITDHLGYDKHERNGGETGNARIRRAVKARGHFPNEQAALKCVYMAIMSLNPTGKGRKRWITRWKAALNAFAITFEGRLTLTTR